MSKLDETCTASQLIKRLQEFVVVHGDLPVYARDADTFWFMPIGLIFLDGQTDNDCHEVFAITTDYGGNPSGRIEVNDIIDIS